jgi:hypothetical protein
VVEVVGALDELGLVGLDGQLHLHHHFIPIQKVHQDVLVALVQSVLDSDDLDARVGIPVSSFYFFVECDNFFLLGRAFASHQITDFKGDELRYIVIWCNTICSFII